MVDIVLASASKARLRILQSAGLDPRVMVSGVDETAFKKLPPDELVTALAEAKATTVVHRLSSGYVIGCDSVLALEGQGRMTVQAIGKPHSYEEARTLWQVLTGTTCSLLTGHCLIDVASARSVLEVTDTRVRFCKLSDEEIDAYVGTGEPLEAAGGFAIDRLGGWFVEYIEGDYSNIVGISLPTLRRLFSSLGVRAIDLWK